MLPEVISDEAHPINRKNNSDLGNSGWQEIWKISIKQTLWVAPSYSDFLSIKSYSSSFKHRFVKWLHMGSAPMQWKPQIKFPFIFQGLVQVPPPTRSLPQVTQWKEISLFNIFGTWSIPHCKPVLFPSALECLRARRVCPSRLEPYWGQDLGLPRLCLPRHLA